MLPLSAYAPATPTTLARLGAGTMFVDSDRDLGEVVYVQDGTAYYIWRTAFGHEVKNPEYRDAFRATPHLAEYGEWAVVFAPTPYEITPPRLFAVGDRVRIIDADPYGDGIRMYDHIVGCTGTVRSVNERCGYLYIEPDEPGRYLGYYRPEAVELISAADEVTEPETTLSVGDRVRVTGPHVHAGGAEFDDETQIGDDETQIGDTGTVTFDWWDGDYSVRLDGHLGRPYASIVISGESLEPLTELTLRDLPEGARVRRTGPHRISSGLDFGDRECKEGWAGTVVGAVLGCSRVQWDVNGSISAIVPSSLSILT